MLGALEAYKFEKTEQTCNNIVQECRSLITGIHATNHPKLVDFDNLHTVSNVELDCGAAVYLAANLTKKGYLIMKHYSNEGGPWKLLDLVLRQLHATCQILQGRAVARPEDKKKYRQLQKCVDIHIDKDSMYILLKHNMMTFDYFFKKEIRILRFATEKTLELVAAVQFLHAHNVAHRDIKNDNICFSEKNELVLIDFDSSAATIMQRSTLPVCTLHTRAPEQLLMQFSKSQHQTYDAQAGDWWSVGCVIAEMLLGEQLFRPTAESVDFLHELKEFATAIQNQLMLPKNDPRVVHWRVKELRRSAAQTEILQLLKGLFQLEPEKRVDATAVYLRTQDLVQ
jgi:serine/threonine protein kinase